MSSLVHNWRIHVKATRDPRVAGRGLCNRLDWHELAHLVQRGCPVMLAVRIIR